MCGAMDGGAEAPQGLSRALMKRSFMRQLSDRNLGLRAGPRRGAVRSGFWKAHPDTCLPPMPGNSSAFWKALPDASPPPRSRPAPEERNSRISALHQNRINYTSQNNPVENIRPHAHLVQPLQEEVDGGDGHQERGYAANQEAIPVYDHIG